LQTLTGPPPAWSRPYVWVGQQEAADCVVAALAMVARFHGLDVPVELLRRQIELRNCGATLAELVRLASILGLGGLPVRVGGEQLEQVLLPAIAHVQGGHYVVLYAFNGAGVVIGDPAAGLVRMSQELFARTCSGHLLLLRPPALT
jgi:ATP-binding cassette subfamily B protein